MSAILLAAIVTLAHPPFQFDGGGQQAFVGRIGKYVEKPIVSNVTERTVGSVTVPWPKDSKGADLIMASGMPVWLKGLSTATRTSAQVGAIVAMRPVALPWYRFESLAPDRKWQDEFREDAELIEVKNGKVTILAKPDRYYLPSYLSFAGFSRHVSCHKFLVNSPLAMSPSIVDEEDFLKAVAYAIGGKLIEKQGNRFIDVDLAAIRQQFAQHFADIETKAKTDLQRSRAALQSEAVRQASDKTMLRLVNTESSSNSYAVTANSKLARQAREYLRLYLLEAQKGDKRDSLVSLELAALITENHDPKNGFWISLDTFGNALLLVMTADFTGIAI